MRRISTLHFCILHFILFSNFVTGSYGRNNPVTVVPYPQSVQVQEGSFKPLNQDVSVRMFGLTGKTKEILADQLKESFGSRFHAVLDPGEKMNPFQIVIGLPENDPEMMRVCKQNQVILDEKLGKEGYLLKISEKQIIVAANTQTGLFYGVQTIRQMIRGDVSGQGLPCVIISDWPAIALRCIMDDISRGPVPNHLFIKEQIKRYSELKINHMSFYIEHVVKTKKYPDFAPSDGGISIEEFAELSEFAKGYHVKLIGNFQSLGHFEKILSFPQYRHLGATDRMLDPLNPESIQFLRDIYQEMAPAFSSEYFSPDCDEAWDLSRGKLADTVNGPGVSRIYANHINEIHAILSGLGKKNARLG